MKTSTRFVSLLILSFLMAAPMMAACRIDSPLDITQIIDPTQTTLKRAPSGSNHFLVFFAVRTDKVNFTCGGGSGGCSTKDGISYKPAISSNVTAVNQTAECRANEIVAAASGVVVAGFRIRFERGLTPSRKTFKLTFDTRDPNLKFTLTSVPELIDPAD
jgi:hypothetical protein